MMVSTHSHGKHIVVIGAGVIGLTTAFRLQQDGYQDLILADDFPAPFETIDSHSQINYTSPWGGAHNAWGKDLPREKSTSQDWRDHSFALTTYFEMEQLHDKYPESGVTFLKGMEMFESPSDEVKNMSPEKAIELGIQNFSFIPRHELPDGVTFGYSFRTWCVNPMVYCSFLLRRFTVLGGNIRKYHVRTPEETFALPGCEDVHMVVNASGFGFADPTMFIIRGQTCLVANDCDVTLSRHNADGSSSFCIPRKYNGGTVVGGTFEPNNWKTEPAPEARKQLLKSLGETYPPILGEVGKLVSLRDIVGRRPVRRGGIRIDKEDLIEEKTVVHAYGAGGRGYELSWGVADAVKDLVSQHGRRFHLSRT